MKIIDFLKEKFGSAKFEAIAEEKIPELSLYRFAFYNAIGAISSAVSRYEFNILRNGERQENNDWFTFNFEPNRNQSKQEFFYDYIQRLLIDGEALCVEQGNEHYIADSFQSDKDSCGFATARFTNIEKNGEQLTRSFDASEVGYFKLDNKELRKLLTCTALEYSNVLNAASKKFKNSAYQKGILKINAQSSGTQKSEEERNEAYNEAIRKFYQDGNAVLPLKKNFEYEELGKYRNTGTSADISDMTFQVYSRVAEAIGMSPYVLMHSSKEPETLKVDFYTQTVEKFVNLFTNEMNRKFVRRDMYLGNSGVQIRIQPERPSDIDELIADGTAIYNTIGSGVASIDEIRERKGLKKLGTEWSSTHFISANLKPIETAMKENENGG